MVCLFCYKKVHMKKGSCCLYLLCKIEPRHWFGIVPNLCKNASFIVKSFSTPFCNLREVVKDVYLSNTPGDEAIENKRALILLDE